MEEKYISTLNHHTQSPQSIYQYRIKVSKKSLILLYLLHTKNKLPVFEFFINL